MRKIILTNNEYYHVFNRGTDKRNVFLDREDLDRFIQSMNVFNSVSTVGSIYEHSLAKKQLGDSISKLKNYDKLVEFIAYCLNPNHYHFILKQVSDNGIQKFMHKLSIGYSLYFNKKNDRSGSLFQGRYKAIHINSNEYLLHLSAYVNLNDRVHQINRLGDSISKSSWDEYSGEDDDHICEKDIILKQFDNIDQYRNFSESSLETMLQRKDMEKILLE
ncbi:transposase [Candidatus Azambacteria bacterium]|nr:transposase [Candidatus Azambacteria bacterium]